MVYGAKPTQCVLHLEFFRPEEGLEVPTVGGSIEGIGECAALDVFNLDLGGAVLQCEDDMRGNLCGR